MSAALVIFTSRHERCQSFDDYKVGYLWFTDLRHCCITRFLVKLCHRWVVLWNTETGKRQLLNSTAWDMCYLCTLFQPPWNLIGFGSAHFGCSCPSQMRPTRVFLAPHNSASILTILSYAIANKASHTEMYSCPCREIFMLVGLGEIMELLIERIMKC